MKRIVIYTTNDEIISLHLVNNLLINDYYKDYKFDIILTNPSFIRKFKIFIVMFFLGSLKKFFFHFKNKISINQILVNNKNCRVIKKIENDNYEYGLSIYCSSKIKVEKFIIYNFHLGNLYDQRGSFIFFYKFIKNWDKICLTFHEISDRFDVGRIINEREIELKNKCFATDIFFLYLKNLDFLIDSVKKINKNKYKKYEDFKKLNLVPSFYKLFLEIFNFYFDKARANRH